MNLMLEIAVAANVVALVCQAVLVVVSRDVILKRVYTRIGGGVEEHPELVRLPKRPAYVWSVATLVLVGLGISVLILRKWVQLPPLLLHASVWLLCIFWLLWLFLSRWSLPYSLFILSVNAQTGTVKSYDLNDPTVADSSVLIVPLSRRIVATSLAAVATVATWCAIHPFPLVVRLCGVAVVAALLAAYFFLGTNA